MRMRKSIDENCRLDEELEDMTSLTALLSKWPLVRQIRERKDGTGLEAMSERSLKFFMGVAFGLQSLTGLLVLRLPLLREW